MFTVHYNEKYYIQPMPLPQEVAEFHLYSTFSYTLAGALEVSALCRSLSVYAVLYVAVSSPSFCGDFSIAIATHSHHIMGCLFA